MVVKAIVTVAGAINEKEAEANSEDSINDKENGTTNTWAKDLEKAMQAIDKS